LNHEDTKHNSNSFSAVRVANGSIAVCVALTAIGVAGNYRSQAMTLRQLFFGGLILLAWLSALHGILFGVVAIARSRGKDGFPSLVGSIAALGTSVIVSWLFPGFGLGDLH
jgi:hypothetical protein